MPEQEEGQVATRNGNATVENLVVLSTVFQVHIDDILVIDVLNENQISA